jgi:WD40 repeat protein
MITWKFHTGPVYDLAFTPDGRLLSCSSDQLIR